MGLERKECLELCILGRKMAKKKGGLLSCEEANPLVEFLQLFLA
jgi:hypothetical protein